MTRPTMRTMRDNIDCLGLNKAGLAADQKLKRQVLERELEASKDPAIEKALSQQSKAVRRHKNACKYNPKQPQQSGPLTLDGRRRRKDHRSPEGFNECGLNTGRSYASKRGAHMEAKKAGFPDILRHPTTILLAAVPVNSLLDAESLQWRSPLRKLFDQFTEGVQVEGSFQIDMKTAEEIAKHIPRDEWPDCFDPIHRPDEVFALFHWHGDISDPYLSKQQVRAKIAEAFPGYKRVCVRNVKEEWITKDGFVTGGAQGYLEYFSMDKTEFDFSEAQQTQKAIVGHARLTATWNKRNRSFSYGKPLAVSGVQIDPNRIAGLELQARLDRKKKNWANLGVGERFVDMWFSGLITVVKNDPRWLSLGDSLADRLKKAMALVKNWSDQNGPEFPCFLDYAETALE